MILNQKYLEQSLFHSSNSENLRVSSRNVFTVALFFGILYGSAEDVEFLLNLYDRSDLSQKYDFFSVELPLFLVDNKYEKSLPDKVLTEEIDKKSFYLSNHIYSGYRPNAFQDETVQHRFYAFLTSYGYIGTDTLSYLFFSPLQLAVIANRIEIVNFLLKSGAKFNKPINLVSCYFPALHLAILSLNVKMVKLLISNGADVNEKVKASFSHFYSPPLYNLVHYHYETVYMNPLAITLLLVDQSNRDICQQMINLLLENGAQYSAKLDAPIGNNPNNTISLFKLDAYKILSEEVDKIKQNQPKATFKKKSKFDSKLPYNQEDLLQRIESNEKEIKYLKEQVALLTQQMTNLLNQQLHNQNIQNNSSQPSQNIQQNHPIWQTSSQQTRTAPSEQDKRPTSKNWQIKK